MVEAPFGRSGGGNGNTSESGSGSGRSHEENVKEFERNSARPGTARYREETVQGKGYTVKEKPTGEEVWIPKK